MTEQQKAYLRAIAKEAIRRGLEMAEEFGEDETSWFRLNRAYNAIVAYLSDKILNAPRLREALINKTFSKVLASGAHLK